MAYIDEQEIMLVITASASTELMIVKEMNKGKIKIKEKRKLINYCSAKP